MMLGGLLFVAFGVVFFVFMHGSTGVDRRCTLIGLDGTDVSRAGVSGHKEYLPLAIGLLVMPTLLFEMSGASGGRA
jgi:hypothetical protein